MGAMLDAVTGFLDREDYNYEVVDGGAAVHMGLVLDNAAFRVRFAIEPDLVVIIVRSDLRVPPARIPAVCEYLARANSGICIGNLCLDFDDRDVSFRSCSISVDAPLSHDSLELQLDAAVRCYDKYFPGLCAVAFAGAAPKGEVDRVIAAEESEADEP